MQQKNQLSKRKKELAEETLKNEDTVPAKPLHSQKSGADHKPFMWWLLGAISTLFVCSLILAVAGLFEAYPGFAAAIVAVFTAVGGWVVKYVND